MSPVERTARAWLESLYLRLAAPDHASWSDDERAGFIARSEEALTQDMDTLRELIAQGQAEVEERWRSRLHHAEGLDHEMVDEAIEYAPEESP